MARNINIIQDFLEDYKTIKLERCLGFKGVTALVNLWCWTARNRPDGKLEDMAGEDIELVSKWTGESGVLFNTLLDLKWIDEADGTYSIHNWMEYTPPSPQSDIRSDKARLKKLAQVNRTAYEELISQGVRSITREEYQAIVNGTPVAEDSDSNSKGNSENSYATANATANTAKANIQQNCNEELQQSYGRATKQHGKNSCEEVNGEAPESSRGERSDVFATTVTTVSSNADESPETSKASRALNNINLNLNLNAIKPKANQRDLDSDKILKTKDLKTKDLKTKDLKTKDLKTKDLKTPPPTPPASGGGGVGSAKTNPEQKVSASSSEGRGNVVMLRSPDVPGETSAPQDKAVTLSEVIRLWNEILVPLGFPRALKGTPQRERAFRARLHDAERRTPGYWRDVFKAMADSPFMRRSAEENQPWLCFTWILREDNLVKVTEGKYRRELDLEKHRPKSSNPWDDVTRTYEEAVAKARQDDIARRGIVVDAEYISDEGDVARETTGLSGLYMLNAKCR